MLIAALTVSLQLAASVAPLPSGHWMPVQAMDHPYEAVMTSDPSGDAGAWSLQDGARLTADVGLKASRIVNELHEEGVAANRPGAVPGFTDETVDLASKADAVPVAAIADEGGSVLKKIARHAVKFKAVIILLIGAIGAVGAAGAAGKLSTGSTNQDESNDNPDTARTPA